MNKKIGTVVGIKSKKTVNVIVRTKQGHSKYGKILTKIRRLLVHNENISLKVGDFVIIEECRPISKKKAWKINAILNF